MLPMGLPKTPVADGGTLRSSAVPPAAPRKPTERGHRFSPKSVAPAPVASPLNAPVGVNGISRNHIAPVHEALPPDDGARKSAPMPSVDAVNLTIAHVNVNGLTGKHLAELNVHLGCLDSPTFLAITETKLDKTTKDGGVIIPGCSLVSRRDRSFNGDLRRGGGIALYVRNDSQMCVALLEHSLPNECSWLVVHTSQGPLLLGVWYRPPNSDAELINCFEDEWLRHSTDVMGTIILGDINVHHQHWLEYSSGTSPAGRKLYAFCQAYDFEERVKKTHSP